VKNYEKVIEERYDKQDYDGDAIIKNIYSPINLTGFYGEFKSASILREFVCLLCKQGKKLDEIKVLDVGCGTGTKTRVLAELLGNASQVYGTEYSMKRMEYCTRMNSSIQYEYADMTKGIPFNIKFDGIIAFVVFMHLSTEEEILSSLANIYNSLDENGHFMWYECYAKSHWDEKMANVDGLGYSKKEMDYYAAKVGFELVSEFGIYPVLPIFNVSTVYLAPKIKAVWLLELLDKLPFKKGNVIRIYKKKVME